MNKVLLILLLAGCETIPPDPTKNDCKEFIYNTKRGDRVMQCKMLWCEGTTSASKTSAGIATLWCEELNIP